MNEELLKNAQETIHRALSSLSNLKYGEEARPICFALQNAISQITPEHIDFLIKNPNGKLVIYPKPKSTHTRGPYR